MIGVVLADAAYDAIASTLPKGAARWPVRRDRDQCFIQVEAALVDRMMAIRRPGESYSEVIFAVSRIGIIPTTSTADSLGISSARILALCGPRIRTTRRRNE
jgi:hypothetical protein